MSRPAIRGAARTLPVLLVLAGLTACANLDAVRDFAATSSKLTGYTDLTRRYLSSPKRILDSVPDGAAFDADRQAASRLLREAGTARESILTLHRVATGYLTALAQLSGQREDLLTPQIDKVAGALAHAPELGLSAKQVDAYGAVAASVTSWAVAAKQARDVQTLVRTHGPAMDALLEGMEHVAVAMKVQLESERSQLRAYEDAYVAAFLTPVGPELPSSRALPPAELERYEKARRVLFYRRQAQLAWAARSYATVESDGTDAVRSAQAAIAGIRAVREGHTTLLGHVDDLSNAQVAALLRHAAESLRTVLANLNDV